MQGRRESCHCRAQEREQQRRRVYEVYDVELLREVRNLQPGVVSVDLLGCRGRMYTGTPTISISTPVTLPLQDQFGNS